MENAQKLDGYKIEYEIEPKFPYSYPKLIGEELDEALEKLGKGNDEELNLFLKDKY